jgi:predicted DNA-binding transcriptional regulator AlpA
MTQVGGFTSGLVLQHLCGHAAPVRHSLAGVVFVVLIRASITLWTLSTRFAILRETKLPGDESDEEAPKLMTIPQIAERRGMTRQRVHRIASTDPKFPAPVLEPGSTRVKYPAEAVDEYFRTRVIQPGRRTDLEARRDSDAGE